MMIAGFPSATAGLVVALGLVAAEGHVELRSPDLQAVVADNAAFAPVHEAGFSGLAELRSRGGASLFLPPNAGLNLEHIFSGDSASYGWNRFEPRQAAMSLERVSPRRAVLRQERTAHWPLATTLTYDLVGPDAIDLTVEATPLEDAWRKQGYVGLFFASYIDAPEDRSIHFIGRSRPGKGDPVPRWIAALPERHGELANHRAAAIGWDPPFDPGLPLRLVVGISDWEYVYPFYYGVSHGKVLIMMFERPRPDAETRFAQSPTGGGGTNPAWDFIFLQRKYHVGKPFRFRARAVYRDWKGEEDVIRAYEAWAKVHVRRPAAARQGG